jgi:hypothetical protein
MYEGLFLSVFTAFEGFLEELFVGLLVADGGLTAAGGAVVPRLTVRSHLVAREMVLSGRNYVEWLPFSRTMERAALFFRGGRPFERLNDDYMANQRGVLERAILVRNAIAHRSRYSISRFENDVIRGTPVTREERSPAGFLRGLLATMPPETRYETYVSGILSIARTLAT